MTPTTRVGIIGDGQLALMLAEALEKRGIAFLCLGEQPDSSMMASYPEYVTFDEESFREQCSIFTLENEFHSTSALKDLLQEKALNLFPDLDSYSYFADKISQRSFYHKCGIPSPKWLALKSESDLSGLSEFEFPFVVKASSGGYDGKGVRIVSNERDLKKALSDFGFDQGKSLLIEEKVSIKKELAQGFLRHENGKFTLLPLVDTIQENGVCNLVQYPPSLPEHIVKEVQSCLLKMMDQNLVGIFNFEFFLDEHGKLLINEGAPRTHNSQHLTMHASNLSQFDLLGLYLTAPEETPQEIVSKPSVMVNILGKKAAPTGKLKLPEFTDVEIHPKLYGKKKSSPGRKLGHVTLVDPDHKHDLLMLGKKILQEYDI